MIQRKQSVACGKDRVNSCAFLDPAFTSGTMVKYQEEDTVQYMRSAMHKALLENKKFILVPYHQSGHWCLIVIVPLENLVFLMDSSHPGPGVTPQESKMICIPIRK